MQIIKNLTARNIFKDFPWVKEDLWGGEYWHNGGHIDTVSEYGGLYKIKKYVEEQGGNIKQTPDYRLRLEYDFPSQC